MTEYIFEVLEKANQSKLLILQHDDIVTFINYDKDHTQMIVNVDGKKKWVCVKEAYEKLKNEIDCDTFRKVQFKF